MAKGSADEVSVGDVIPETRFFDVSLDDVGVPAFDESIEIAEIFRSELQQLRMLVLGGHQLEDKTTFARHLAWHLRANLGGSIPVKQCHPRLARLNFDEALRQFKSQSILLFPSVFPHHFGHDLKSLYEEICEHGHFAIVSTESDRTDWSGLEVLEARLWKEPATADVYPPIFLAELLKRELKEVTRPWSDGSLETLAVRLRTPNRIRLFAKLIKAEKGSIDPSWVDRVVGQLNGNEYAVGSWYRQLSPRHQSLALALALLEGVSRDQALAAMEVLWTQVWHPRDSTFGPPPDAFDLPPLGAYFGGIGEGAGSSLVICHSPNHRRAVLRAAWECREREVQSILPVLARIAGDSGIFGSEPMQFRPGNQAPETSQTTESKEKPESPPGAYSGWLPHGLLPNLFGSPERIQQIQGAVSSSLSEIGRISPDDLKHLLLQLATSQERTTRTVVAAALARWREREAGNPELGREQEDRLFNTLERWCSEAFELEIQNLVELRTTEPYAHARSTVALALSFASLFDLENELDPRLLELFKALSKDPRDTVRATFRAHTLPWVIALHLRQIEPFLSDELALELESLFGLSVGLAAAARIRPHEALPIIDRWYCEGLAAKASRRGKLPPAKKKLAATVLAYGWIAADNLAPKDCSRADALDRLRRVYANETSLRWLVVEAMRIQIWRNLEGNQVFLRNLLEDLTRQDQISLVPGLVALHAKERQTLPGSSGLFVVLGQGSFPVWTNPSSSPRPLTRVESVMKIWLLDGSAGAGIRVATRTLGAISETQVEVEERRLREIKIREKSKPVDAETLPEQIIQEILSRKRDPEAQRRAGEELTQREASLRARSLSDPLHLIPVLCFLFALLVTCFSARDRVVVQEQLAQLLEHWQSSISVMRNPRAQLARIFGRFQGDPEDLERIVNHLVRAVWLFRFRWPLLAVSGFLILALGLRVYLS